MMFQEFYSHSTLLHLPLVALALFVVTFTFAVWHTFRRNNGDANDDVSRLPLLHDDITPEPLLSSEGGRHE